MTTLREDEEQKKKKKKKSFLLTPLLLSQVRCDLLEERVPDSRCFGHRTLEERVLEVAEITGWIETNRDTHINMRLKQVHACTRLPLPSQTSALAAGPHRSDKTGICPVVSKPLLMEKRLKVAPKQEPGLQTQG